MCGRSRSGRTQVKRRGGGLALALRQDEGTAAGAALDHVVAPGNLDVTGRHGRRRRGRCRAQRRRRRRGEHADALTERGARASHVGVYSGEFKTATSETVGSDVAAWRIQGWVACVIVGKRARVELAKRRGGGIALVLDIDDPPTAGAALDHVETSGDLGLVVLPGRHGWRGWRLRRRRRRRRGRQ